jgi:hypothetical protein
LCGLCPACHGELVLLVEWFVFLGQLVERFQFFGQLVERIEFFWQLGVFRLFRLFGLRFVRVLDLESQGLFRQLGLVGTALALSPLRRHGDAFDGAPLRHRPGRFMRSIIASDAMQSRRLY